MRHITLLAAIIMLLPLPVLADDIDCAGPFGIDADAAQLERYFGSDHVTTTTSPNDPWVTEIFGSDAARQLRVVWWREATDPSYVELGAAWSGPLGLRLGLTLAEVEAINDAPLALSVSGDFQIWSATPQAGALAGLPGGCLLSLRFTATPDHASLADARLSWLAIGYPSPDFR